MKLSRLLLGAMLFSHYGVGAFQRPAVTLNGRASVPGRRDGSGSATRLHEMKRPILDRLASFVFKLENDRVANASVEDDRGRSGEPMEWAEENSFANKFSQIVSGNDVGYRFKQGVADLVAGEYDVDDRKASIRNFIDGAPVAMYSFTTCPFCRKAKDYLDSEGIPYQAIELDLLPGNEGNEIRAELGKLTRRTSVPSIFIGGECSACIMPCFAK